MPQNLLIAYLNFQTKISKKKHCVAALIQIAGVWAKIYYKFEAI